MDAEYWKKQVLLREMKIATLENILFSYKKDKVVNLRRISKLSRITSTLLKIDDDGVLHLLVDGKFDIKLEQKYISDCIGFCYICLSDDIKLTKFSCSHGICNSCLIKNLYRTDESSLFMNKCFVCKFDIKNTISLN